ncbi:hypothetical protein AYO40_02385 [Planctomycetaceae bacterium SCGC AG-212-D15]|nr:hypothetical protein AYO40_02385 [Planctomycetaceae bacterium SCGC AG-212-D15]
MATEAIPFTRRRLLVLTGCACAMLVLVGLRPISDVDLFWQLKLGQMMLHEGGLVKGDPFTFTHAGEPFAPLCWLAQVVYAVVFQFGEWRALQILDNLLFVGAFGVAALSVRPSDARSAALAGALALGFVIALPHNSLRPQTFALFAFALLLALRVGPLPTWGKIVAGAILLVLWQNLHPSVVVGGVALAAVTAGDAWEWWRGRRELDAQAREPKASAPARASGSWTTNLCLLVLVGLAQFATPVGFKILAVSQRNRELSLRPPQPAREWLPCWDPFVARDALPAMALAGGLSVILLLRCRSRVRPADLALALVMGALAAWSFRFALFMAVALVPVWARWMQEALPPDLFPEPAPTPPDARPPLRVLVQAAVLVVVLAAVLPVLLRSRTFTDDVPGLALGALEPKVPAGRIYNFQPYGGPLSFANDDWRVLMDGRIYVYSNTEWDDYYAAASGATSVDRLVERYSPDAFFLHPIVQKGLIDRLLVHPQWQMIYPRENQPFDNCCVFVRREPGSSVALRGAR